MCGALGGRNQNRVVPVSDLPSERVEIRKDRWLRVVHYKPRISRSDSGYSRDDVQSNRSAHSAGSATSGAGDPDYQKIIVIFFIHGVGGCADLWYEQVQYFCKAGYEVVAPDLLGHGQSSAPNNIADYEFSELSYDLLRLFDRYHKKRNVLVGHSYGASFCAVIACERARLVSKMVLISGGGPTPLVGVGTCDMFCLPTLLLSCIKPVFLSVYERRAYNSVRARSLRRKVKAFSAPPFVMKAVMAGQVWEDGDESYHQELMVPALLIYGAQDKFVTLEEEQWMQEVIYSSSLEVIQDAGHMVMVESPVRVNWLIHNFLQRDATTRSLHNVGSQYFNFSSKGSLHVASKDKPTPSRNEAELQTVSESINEGTRRRSSGMALEPSGENSFNIGNSQASLSVLGNKASTRMFLTDDVEEISRLQTEGSEICLEIPQMGVIGNNSSQAETEDNTMQASTSDFWYSEGSLRQDKESDKTNISMVVNSSLHPSLGEAVHIMRPLAGVAWTKNSIGSRTSRRSSLQSFLRPSSKMELKGSKSAPSSPKREGSTEFKNKSVQ